MHNFPQVIAHRGASFAAPQNTIPAFEKALELGCDAIELDVHLTRDGRVVVIHDSRLERTTNGRGQVLDYTLEDIKKLDAGNWFSKKYLGIRIPTLEEAIKYISMYNKIIYIELKGNYENFAEKVISIVESLNYTNKIVIASFNKRYLENVNKINDDIETAYCSFFIKGKPTELITKFPFDALCISYVYVKKICSKDINKIKRKGIKINGFTVNDKLNMIVLICKGIDGIITDRPEKLLKLKRYFML